MNSKTARLLIKLILFLLAFFFPSSKYFCQTGNLRNPNHSKYSIGGRIGLNDFHMKDEFLSPDVFKGILFSSAISLNAEFEKTRHAIDIYFSYVNPERNHSQLDIIQYIGSISYSFFHSIDTWRIYGSPFTFSLGAGLSTFVMNTDYNINSSLGLGKNYDQSWYWSHALDIKVRGDYYLSNNQSFTVQLSSPVIKIVSRPANGHWLDSRYNEVSRDNFLNAATLGKREFIWDNAVLDFTINYSQRISNSINLTCGYSFNFTSADKPLTMKSYMNNLLIGFDYTF